MLLSMPQVAQSCQTILSSLRPSFHVKSVYFMMLAAHPSQTAASCLQLPAAHQARMLMLLQPDQQLQPLSYHKVMLGLQVHQRMHQQRHQQVWTAKQQSPTGVSEPQLGIWCQQYSCCSLVWQQSGSVPLWWTCWFLCRCRSCPLSWLSGCPQLLLHFCYLLCGRVVSLMVMPQME